ncbi:IS200/IS605 family transposase [Methylomarinum vadi]|uniref:IS200/IS605 family transposase n=1 Tax=Methylomarinum vadi TaxID=438855 RepID=UPI0005673CDA|nr:IS200/IS605 family transposase [Methylomarinum vadi]
MDYRYGSHTVYQIEYHFVWVTKYRYKVLKDEIAETSERLGAAGHAKPLRYGLSKGVVSKDHVHILVSAPPTMAPSGNHEANQRDELREAICSKKFPHLKKRYWVDIFGPAVIFAATVGAND